MENRGLGACLPGCHWQCVARPPPRRSKDSEGSRLGGVSPACHCGGERSTGATRPTTKVCIVLVYTGQLAGPRQSPADTLSTVVEREVDSEPGGHGTSSTGTMSHWHWHIRRRLRLWAMLKADWCTMQQSTALPYPPRPGVAAPAVTKHSLKPGGLQHQQGSADCNSSLTRSTARHRTCASTISVSFRRLSISLLNASCSRSRCHTPSVEMRPADTM